MIKRVLLGVAAVGIAGIFVIAGSSPAGATVSPECQGNGQFVKLGKTYHASDTGVDVIDRVDDVNWDGSITGTTGNQPYSGKIEVELPPPFGKVSVDSWSGTTDSTSNSGTKHYDLPGFVPANVEFEVSGSHTQGPITCTGSVKLKIEGSGLGPFSLATLALTLAFGAGLVLAGLQGNYAGS